MAAEICGWLIKGDSACPCVLKPHAHKYHKDIAAVTASNSRDRSAYEGRSEVRNRRNELKREHRRQRPEVAAKEAEANATYRREHAAEIAVQRKNNYDRANELKRQRRLEQGVRGKRTPEEIRAAERFYNKQYHREHKAEITVRKVNYRRQFPEIMRKAAHRRRARLRSVPSHPWTRVHVRALYGDSCFYCQGPYEHTDHVIPLSKGGWDVLSNLRPSCASCNCSKQARMPSLGMQLYVWQSILLAGLA